MTKKVFCSNCKYLKLRTSLGRKYLACEHKSNIEVFFTSSRSRKKLKGFKNIPLVLNWNNDCKNYKEKWLVKLFSKIKKKAKQ